MSFKFNFINSAKDDGIQEENIDGNIEEFRDQSGNLKSREIEVSQGMCVPGVNILTLKCSNGLELCYLDSSSLESHLCKDDTLHSSKVVSAIKENSDLRSGQYEGGLKVWECAVDLVNFLCEQKISFQGKKVLELGCGSGLPGLLAVKLCASEVHFQDYNEEVIQYFTMPNVKLADTPSCQCRFFSGDWSSLSDLISSVDVTAKYDYILTAETIYNINTYCHLHNIFASLLRDLGTIYVAAKSHYFGVGGTTKLFMDFVSKQKVFDCQICHVIKEGIDRQILQLRRIAR